MSQNPEKLKREFAGLAEEERRKRIEGLTGTFAPHLSAEELEQARILLSEAIGDLSWRVRKAAVEVFLTFPDSAARELSLSEALRSEDNAGKRNSAIEILIRLGRKALPLVEKLARDQDAEVRKFAVEALGEIGGREVEALIFPALEDPDENTRMAAVEALGKAGTEKSVGPLLSTLGTATGLNFLILKGLKELGNRGAVLPVEPLLPHLEDPTLREVALSALGGSRNSQALPVLAQRIREGSLRFKEKALLALSELLQSQPTLELAPAELNPGELTPLLESPKENLRLAVLRVLSRIQAPEILEALLPVLGSENEEAQSLARRAIQRQGAPALENLVQRYRSFPGEQRPRILELLGGGDVAAGAALVPRLEKLIQGILADPGSDFREREEAALAAGRLGFSGLVPELADLLAEVEGELTAAALSALRLLAEKDHSRVVTESLVRLKGGSECQRCNLITLLGDIQAQAAVTDIRFHLKAGSAAIREAAALTLSEVRSLEAEEDLILALADEDPRVRVAAARALGRIGQKKSLEPLLHALKDEDLWARTSVVEALGEIGASEPRTLSALGQVLESGEGPAAEAAVRALGRIGGAGGRTAILPALRASDPEVVTAALETLAPLREGEVPLELILKLFSHPAFNVRLRLAQALKDLVLKKDPAISRALKDRLESEEDPLVREAIMALLRGGKGGAQFPGELNL